MTRVVAISGGVGGAKVALGLARAASTCGLRAQDILIVANTGDDFTHLGMYVSPDIDTLLYALSDRDDQAKGWGRRDETWSFMEALREIGGEDWFQLGDRDLALHVERTRLLASGSALSAITAHVADRFGISVRLVPMSDDPVRTRVQIEDGWMEFQRWFVGARCVPVVRSLEFVGADTATPLPAILEALADPDLEAVLICPSNPFLSVGPVLAIPALRRALEACAAPRVAIAPVIGGAAVKGPTVKMMAEFGIAPSAASVGRHYAGLIDGFLLDTVDAGAASELPGLRTRACPILMTTLDDRIRVARAALELARSIGRRA